MADAMPLRQGQIALLCLEAAVRGERAELQGWHDSLEPRPQGGLNH